jgi:Fe-S-cluster-containing dehydrogenase component
MNEVIATEKCTGCRTCEIACSYHHKGVFGRKTSSVEIRRYEERGEFGLVLYLSHEGSHMACDCTPGDEYCLKYCPEIARDELRDLLREKKR